MDNLYIYHDSTIYKNLNIVNYFMFRHVVGRQEVAPKLVEMLTKRKFVNPPMVFSEMSQSVSLSSKDTRFDILLIDDYNNFYNIEMENRNLGNLGPRIDYYANILALKSLKVGDDYDKLPNRTIIFITNFDPFGQSRCIYTFKTTCEEDHNIKLDTRRDILFLNLKGKIGYEDLSPEIQDFMKIAVTTTKEVADTLKSDFGRYLYTISESVKTDENLEKKFMGQYYDHKYDIAQSEKRGEERGIEIGRKIGLALAIEILTLFKQGLNVSEIATKTGASVADIIELVDVKA